MYLRCLHPPGGPTVRNALHETLVREGAVPCGTERAAGAELWELPAAGTGRRELLSKLLGPVRSSGSIVSLETEPHARRIALFDLDATLIPCEFVDELAALRGIAAEMRTLTARAMAGAEDFRTSYLRRLAMLGGTPLSAVERTIDCLPLTPGAAETVAALHRAGCRTAIVTGGYARLGRAIQNRLGIERLYATELEEADGRLTGRPAGEVVDGAGKARALADCCRRFGLTAADAVVVGDGANDLEMLAAAGQAILYTAIPDDRTAAQPLDRILPLIGR